MSESPSLTPDALESLLGDLDEERFVAFVADLWSRGGWTTEGEGSTLAVTRGGETNRLLVWTDDRSRIERLLGNDPDIPDAEGIDAVVTRRRDAASARRIAEAHDADVIDSAGLYDRLLYAIDRDAARELCRRYFGDDIEPRPPRDQEPDTQMVAGVVTPRTFLVAAALLALVAAVGVGLSGQPPGETDPAPETPVVDGADTPAITPAGGGAATTDSPGRRTGTPTRRLIPSRERFEELRANAPAYRNASVSCVGSPGPVVETAVGALRFNDPERDGGLQTVWRLTGANGTFSAAFEEGITSAIYRPLYDFDRVAFESSAEADTETAATVETTTRAVVVARNGSIARYEFRLRRTAADCWTVDQIFRTPIGGQATPDTATSTDPGTPTEANTSTDLGTATEANTSTDGGVTSETEPSTDEGTPSETDTPIDSGTSTDTGTNTTAAADRGVPGLPAWSDDRTA